MAEIEKLTGHGAPSVLLPGSKGQIYEDLDTRRLYECKGERGFVRVDGDDQDNQFNWVLKGVDISYNDLQDKPEQGGSTGGVEIFPVHLTQFSDTECRCDKTIDEIKQAAGAGKLVIGFLSFGEGTVATFNYDVDDELLYTINVAWSGTTGVTSLSYSNVYFDNTTSTWKIRYSTFDVTPIGAKA